MGSLNPNRVNSIFPPSDLLLSSPGLRNSVHGVVREVTAGGTGQIEEGRWSMITVLLGGDVKVDKSVDMRGSNGLAVAP